MLADFLSALFKLYVDLNFVYMEINPIVVVGERITPLDMAAKIDETAAFLCGPKWGEIDFPAPFGERLFLFIYNTLLVAIGACATNPFEVHYEQRCRKLTIGNQEVMVESPLLNRWAGTDKAVVVGMDTYCTVHTSTILCRLRSC